MIKRINYFKLIVIAITLFTIGWSLSCKKDTDSTTEADKFAGTWTGSFYCGDLPEGNTDALCTNIKIDFAADAQYKIYLETPPGSESFSLANSGLFNVEDSVLYLSESNCEPIDSSCSISAVLDGNNIRRYGSDMQIRGADGWYLYEKFAE